MQLFSAIIALSTIAVANPLERRQAPAAPIAGASMPNTTMGAASTAARIGVDKVMPAGVKDVLLVTIGAWDDRKVNFMDPWGNWHEQFVRDPSALFNSKVVVKSIDGKDICSGNWGVLYQMTDINTSYPPCSGNLGQFNGGGGGKGGYPNYVGLQWGTCPAAVYHWTNKGWINSAFKNCWTGYWNNGMQNDGNSAVATFKNGMKVGWCCFN